MAATRSPIEANFSPTLGSQRVPYFLGVIAATVGLCVMAATSLAATAACVVAAWVLFTVVLRPPRNVAGYGFFIAVTTALLLQNYSNLGAMGRFWAFVNLGILSLPFLVRPLKRTQGFPTLHFWCLLEGVYVYMSSMFSTPTPNLRGFFPPEVRESGYRILAIFLAALVGSALIVNGLFNKYVPQQRVDRSESSIARQTIKKAYIILGVSVMGVIGIYNLGLDVSLGSLTDFAHLLVFGGWLMLVLLLMDRKLPLIHLFTVLVVPAVWVTFTLGAGALYQAAYPGFLVAALYIARFRRVPWALLGVALVVLLVLNSQKGEFRQDKDAGLISGPTTELTGNWIDRSRDNLDTTTQEDLTDSAYRFANSDLLGYVDTWVPSRYPYFGTEVYSSLPQVLLPRVILPDKGSFNWANRFGREYELIGRSDYRTTVNMPMPVEAYVGAGMGLLVVVGIFVGVFLAMLDMLFRRGTAPILIVASLITLQLVQSVESGVQPLILVLPFTLALLPLFSWACRGPSDHDAGDEDDPAGTHTARGPDDDPADRVDDASPPDPASTTPDADVDANAETDLHDGAPSRVRRRHVAVSDARGMPPPRPSRPTRRSGTS